MMVEEKSTSAYSEDGRLWESLMRAWVGSFGLSPPVHFRSGSWFLKRTNFFTPVRCVGPPWADSGVGDFGGESGGHRVGRI
jgi:hypothetical protein